MDARIRYTKNRIGEVFFNLLKEKPVGAITVTEICSMAEINRATFYRYYDNPIDYLEKYEAATLDEIQKRIVDSGTHDFVKIFYIILETLLEDKDRCLIIFSETGDKVFKNKIFSLCYGDAIKIIRNNFPNLSEEYQEWLYYFLAEGCSGILSRWIDNGMDKSPKEVVAFLNMVIESVNSMADIR